MTRFDLKWTFFSLKSKLRRKVIRRKGTTQSVVATMSGRRSTQQSVVATVPATESTHSSGGHPKSGMRHRGVVDEIIFPNHLCPAEPQDFFTLSEGGVIGHRLEGCIAPQSDRAVNSVDRIYTRVVITRRNTYWRQMVPYPTVAYTTSYEDVPLILGYLTRTLGWSVLVNQPHFFLLPGKNGTVIPALAEWYRWRSQSWFFLDMMRNAEHRPLCVGTGVVYPKLQRKVL